MEGPVEIKREESTIMEYYNDICKRQRIAEIEGNLDYDSAGPESTTPVENETCIGFEDVCREFGPWVWADEFDDYEQTINDLRRVQCRLTSTVPSHVEEISKNLIKLKWNGLDEELFEGFGPWCQPTGYEPPEPILTEKPVKKIRKKEKIKETEIQPKINEIQSKVSKSSDKIPVIMALTSHKTYSTPVDPVELKKRLADLLLQRSAKGDQQAMELNKINMKPFYFQRFICNTNASSWLPRKTNPTYQLDKTAHRSHSSQIVPVQQNEENSEKINFDCETVKLPPVPNRIPTVPSRIPKHKSTIPQRWPNRATISHRVNPKKANLKQQTKETIPESAIKREIEKYKKVSMNELVRENEAGELTVKTTDDKRPNWGRKLGELSKNTKTEIFKQFSNFDI